MLMLTWRRIWRSVLTSMAGSRCTPTQMPLTKILVACKQQTGHEYETYPLSDF